MTNMDEAIEDYKKALYEKVQDRANSEREPQNYAFESIALEMLSDEGDLVDAKTQFFKKSAPNGNTFAIDGFAFDDADKSISLFICDFAPEEDHAPLNNERIDYYSKQMLNFLEACVTDKLRDLCDPYDDIVRVGQLLRYRIQSNIANNEIDKTIERIKLFVISNREYSSRIKAVKDKDVFNKVVTTNIWSLNRFYEYEKSGKDSEPITIDFLNDYGGALQCLKAKISGGNDYEAYLSIIPGKQLAAIYGDYGSKLLEGNVRAFLGAKNKFNSKIISTIVHEPSKFFTYNNGIAVTGDDVTLSDDGRNISSIRNMQIINGGQTTASLFTQYRKDPSLLNDVYVAMKLTIIKNAQTFDSMVANISRFSNSQSKVTDADFFSSHPFHVLFEKLSKKTPSPIAGGQVSSTYWYYERSRGKYNQETFNSTEAQKKAFESKFPTRQRIKKEELAKYYTTCVLLQPQTVSLGSSKCMKAFAKTIDDLYKQDINHTMINTLFFQRCVAYTILFRSTDKMVTKADWYKPGLPKANIIPYSIAGLIAHIPQGYSLDFDLIWKKQGLYESLNDELEKFTLLTKEFFDKPKNNMLVSEYAKREETWNEFKNIPFELSQAFKNDLVRIKEIEEKSKEAQAEQKNASSAEFMTEIYNLGAEYWKKLLEQGYRQGLLTSNQSDLLKLAINMNSPTRPTNPSDKQVQQIKKIREMLLEKGVVI